MDPSRKRAIRLSVALTAALMLAAALAYVSFNSGRDELTAAQLQKRAVAGGKYILAGTVENGSIVRGKTGMTFRVLAPNGRTSVAVKYSGVVPDPFAQGRAVMVNVTDQNGTFVGEENSLTTKCPSKYQAASGAAVS